MKGVTMPNNKNSRGFAVPGDFGRRLAYANSVGVLVKPTREALDRIHTFVANDDGADPHVKPALEALNRVPAEGARLLSGEFLLSTRTHSIIEGPPSVGEMCTTIWPAVVAPEGHELVSASVTMIEIELIVRYIGEPGLVKASKKGQDLYALVATECGVERQAAKLAFFSAIYGEVRDERLTPAWERISARYPGFAVLRDEIMAHGAQYIQRRASDWRNDVLEAVARAVDMPIVLVMPASTTLYFEVPAGAASLVVALATSIDSHVEAYHSDSFAGIQKQSYSNVKS
jgi:hypothetical protein